MNKNELLDFVTPYYADKDVTHNMWHIGLVIKYVEKIVKQGNYAVDHDKLILAAYFHGFIYSHEKEIRNWLAEQRFPERDIELIARISRGSQRPETPETLEGKILHDAHVVEGGNNIFDYKVPDHRHRAGTDSRPNDRLHRKTRSGQKQMLSA